MSISPGVFPCTQQILASLVHDGLLTAEEAAIRLHKNVNEIKMLL